MKNYIIKSTDTGLYSVIVFGEVIAKVNSYYVAMDKIRNIKDLRKQKGFDT